MKLMEEKYTNDCLKMVFKLLEDKIENFEEVSELLFAMTLWKLGIFLG